MAEVFANDGQAVVSSGGTTAPVAGTVETWTLTASSLPVLSGSQYFYAADDNAAGEPEKFLFTANNGTTATVTRGADGTMPVAHSAGFSVSQVISRATLQGLLPLSGGTMTGAVTLPGNPSSALQAAPKQYVDNHAGITDWLNVVTQFGAVGDGSTDCTTAVQNAISAAAGTPGVGVYIPAGSYRVSQLTLATGTILRGSSSGTYPGGAGGAISGVTRLERIASTNLDLLVAADGINYCRIFDLAIDGNKNNNTSGMGLKIADGAAAQETQFIIERCFFHDNPDSNLYLGNNRRGSKVQYSVFNYSANGDGITVCGSDNLILSCICGSNTSRAGINLGSTVSQNWSSFGSNTNSTTTHVFNCDIYGNLVGIAIPSNVTRSMIIGNGIDRNLDQGITVYNGDCNTITGNALHSNGQAANNTYGHIDLGAGVTSVAISDNTFGPVDGGITNICSYGVTMGSGIAPGAITGNVGSYDSSDVTSGLVGPAGSNSSPSVRLSYGGAIVQGANTTQHAFQIRSAAGATLFDMDNSGTFTVNDGTGKFLAGFAAGNAHAAQNLTANGNTITISGTYNELTSAGAYTGLILTAGTLDGEFLILNNTGSYTLTFAASGSNVEGGSAVTIPSGGGAALWLVWSASQSLWYIAEGSGGGGGGTVTSVTAGDTSIVVGGTGAAPTIETGTLDVIAADHPPAGNWSNNSHKITSLANGSGAQDAAAFGQIPVADSTATNILPNGTQAAGGNGKWADSGHVHPLPSGFLPADAGFLEWNYDPVIASTQTALPTGGQITLIRVNVRVARSVTSVIYFLGTLGSGLTSGECFAGLYSSSGTLIGTSADQTANWNTGGTTGLYTTALTGGPFNVSAGFCWVALLFNGTTGPAIGRCNNLATAMANAGFAASASRYAHTATGGQTSLTNFTPSGNVQTAVEYWAAVS